MVLFKCFKSNFSLHKKENFIILHVSDKEEISFPLLALLHIEEKHFKVILRCLFWMHNALMSLKIIGYLKSQSGVFQVRDSERCFCQFGIQSILFSFPVCKTHIAYPASQECSHCLYNAFPVRHRSVHRKLLPSTRDSRFTWVRWTCPFSS